MDDFIYLEKLDMLFNAHISILPTSVISERVFSKSGFIKKKLSYQGYWIHLVNIDTIIITHTKVYLIKWA